MGGGESVWREVARVAVEYDGIELANEEELGGWESVMLAALSVPGASGWDEMWSYDGEYGERKTSLLHLASRLGSERVVDWVMERGGDLEWRDSDGVTPLWHACASGRLGMVRKLVESGADVTTKNSFSVSVLTAASWEGHADVVAYVLGLGVLDVAAEGTGLSSSLHCACEKNHPEVVKLLVEGGADVDVEGRDEHGALFTACETGKSEVVRLLVESGAWSGLAKDGEVWMEGLMTAAAGGHAGVVRVLLNAGMDVDSVDEIGNTALCRASRLGRVDVVRVLVDEGGADVNRTGRGGGTPLMKACVTGKEDLVRMLLEAGADVGVRDSGGETALDIARRRGWDGLVAVLEARYRPPGAERSGAELGGSVLGDE